MKKTIALILAFFALFSIYPKDAFCVEIPSEYYEQLPDVFDIDLSFLEEYYNALKMENNQSFDEFFQSLMAGELDGKEIIKEVIKIFSKSLGKRLPQIISLIVLTLIYGVLGTSLSVNLKEDVKKVIRLCLLLSITTYLSVIISSTINDSKALMETLKGQMFGAFPIILSILFALGGNTSTALFQPILYFLSVIMTEIVVNLIYPLFIFSFVISLLSYVSDSKMDKIATFTKTLSTYVLRVVLIIFTSALGISGVFAYGQDSVVYKTTKLAMQGSIPIVGSFVKDSMDMVMITGANIKNTLGIAVLIIFLLTVISPLISTYLSAISLRAVSAITSTFSDDHTSTLFERCAEGIETVGATLVSVLLMFTEGVFAIILSTGYLI